MKGFLACALALVEDIVKTGGDKSLTRPIHLAFSYDEEIGCLGAAPLVNEFKNLGLKANFAVIGEPTEMKVANAHKGINSFYTNIEGKEAHSSLEHLGVNAIMIAARLVNFIESMQDSAKNRTEAIDSRFTPAYTTFNVGVIEGGTANNIIAQACKFVWEFRPTPAENTAEIKQKFDEFCTKLESEARLKNTSSRIENIVRSSVPGLIADSSENHLSIAMKIAETNVLKAVPFCTEAGIFHNSGIPSVVIGPGSIEQAHQPDEFIEIKQLEQAISFMTNLRNYCCS
jgi:acetylornithine deacetylase